jgi:hypothetical protein
MTLAACSKFTPLTDKIGTFHLGTLWEPSIPFAFQVEPGNRYHRLIKEGVIRQKELAEHTGDCTDNKMFSRRPMW